MVGREWAGINGVYMHNVVDVGRCVKQICIKRTLVF